MKVRHIKRRYYSRTVAQNEHVWTRAFNRKWLTYTY